MSKTRISARIMRLIRINVIKRWKEKSALLVTVLVIVLLPIKDVFLAAQGDLQAVPVSSNVVNEDDVLRQFKTNRFLERIKAEITSGEDDLLQVNRQITDTEARIQAAGEKIATLKQQLDNLDQRIKSSREIITNVETQIARKQSEIATLGYQLEQNKVEISFQRQMIMEYLKVLFKDQNELNNWEDDESNLSTLKLLLSDDSTGEKLRSIRYSEVLEQQGREIFERLGELMDEQEANQKIMEVKKHTLIMFHQTLNEQKKELELMRQAKEALLEQTKGEEAAYRKLLEQARAEQEDVLLEVETLRKNLVFIQDRIQKLGDQFNPDDYAKLLNVGENKKLLAYLTSGFSDTEFSPIWPVKPSRGISAYFRDTSYARAFGFAHNAVDIRVNQETPIKAPVDGIIYKAKDNGYGYSYIQIAHDGGYLTTYGHMYKIFVEEGQEVRQGDIIGLSGGMPGTKGAGVYTTGPHLHFEVIKDGLYVDPLEYLNLAFVPFETLSDKYVDKALGDRKKIRRIPLPQKVRYQPAVQSLENVPAENSNY